MKILSRYLLLLTALLSPLQIGATMTENQLKDIVNDRFTPALQTPYTVTPKVDVVSGTYLEESCDLIIAGAEPLHFRRFYYHLSPYDPRLGNWNYNPESYAMGNLELGRTPQFMSCGEREGSVRSFESQHFTHNSQCAGGNYSFDSGKHKNTMTYDGKSHPLNTKISFRRPHHAEHFSYEGEIREGDGAVRSFTTPNHCWLNDKMVRVKCTVYINGRPKEMVGNVKVAAESWTPYQLLMTQERLPSGNILCYDYENWKDESVFPKFRRLKSITAFNSTKTKLLGYFYLDYPTCKVVGSDGRQVVFGYNNHPMLTAAHTAVDPNITYQYENNRLCQITRPDGRIFKTEYDGANKVKAQLAPVGPNGELCPVNRYVYHPFATEVYDTEDNKTVYCFDGDKRITQVESYDKNTLYRIDRHTWDVSGDLLSKTVEDATGKVLLKQAYRYDKNHNPIEETLSNALGSHTLYRTYSDDGFNLKLTESDRPGKYTRYIYKPNTNLLLSEFVYVQDALCQRTFHFYDDCAVCIKTLVDDGTTPNPDDLSGVTYRKITEISPKQTLPCIGLPIVVQEKAQDASGQEIPLEKVTYTYTPFGKVLREEHSAEGSYTLHHCYDGQERLISTTDALGHTTHYSYDANHNVTAIVGPRPDQRKEIVYDKANRPIEERIYREDAPPLVTQKKYNRLSQVVASIDASGFETRYTYDALGRPAATYHPDGAIERKEYDVLGNIILEVDPKGYATHKEYNFRGQPTVIYHPDGTAEEFTYNPEGTLATHRDRSGVETFYTYDAFDRILETCTALRTTSTTYSPFHPLTATDGEGVVTTFTYDCAGRKTSEEKGGQKTTYSYDAWGRCIATHKGNTSYVQKYDLMGRLVEKTTLCAGKLIFQESYAYDAAGNQTHTTTALGTTETTYDTTGQPLCKKDALGHCTHTTYHYPQGLVISSMSPKNIKTTRIHDARGRESAIITSQEKTLQKTEKTYDLNGNCTTQTHHVFEGTTPLKTVTHTFEYGPCNRIESICECGEKRTQYLYENGKLATIIKPDQQQIHHSYDLLGRLARYYASDFDYYYTYDRCDRPLCVEDAVTRTTTTLCYDALGNVTQETLANGLTCSYAYDTEGKRIELTLPDASTIGYTWKGDHLASITRGDYTHTYSTRDLAGHLIKAQLPGKLGRLKITYDPLGRWKTLTGSSFTAHYTHYDATGNLCSYRYTDPCGSVEITCTYNPLDQLLSENGHTYTYDSLYNRLSKNTHAYTLNSLSQLLSDGEQDYQYDLNGNLLFDGECCYTYDTLDRLIQVKKGTSTLTYTYDPFHRRLSKNQELYIWDGQNEIGKTDACHNIQELRVLGEGLGAEIGSAVLLELYGASYVPQHDHRGCLVTLTSLATNTPIETYRYTAFGEELTGNCLSPWQFASKRIDAETGFVYFGRRYYAPHIGRWITADPQGFNDGPNLYAYLHNSPLTDFDLYGLWSWSGFRQGLYRWTDRSMQFACPLTHQLGRHDNLFAKALMLPTAIFEVGTLVGTAAPRAALSLAEKSIEQIGRHALQRLSSRAAMQAERVIASGIEHKLLQSSANRAVRGGILNGPASSATSAVRLKNTLSAQEIAGGHAYEKHILSRGEFPGFIRTRWQFANHIENIFNNPTEIKTLRNNRTAYWHQETGTVVIRNPHASDGGTAFQPTEGVEYFKLRLR